MTAHETLLLLDGQTTQALACARSLGRAGYRVLVASHRRRPLAAWSRFAHAVFVLEDQSVPAFAAARAWAARQGARVVLPLTERSCHLCNVERGAWENAGVIVGCGPEEMLLHAFDKARTLAAAAACGLHVPPSRSPESLDGYHDAAAALGFPCVVKPRFSNAWNGVGFLPDRGISYVNDDAALERAVLERRQGDHWPLLQAYVPGRGIGVFALCDHGTPRAWFAHERLRDIRPSGSGSSLRRSAPLDPCLRESTARLLQTLGWHGPAMLEFRQDASGVSWLMEMNGRFWGSLQLAVTAGVDFPALWLRVLLGQAPRTGHPPAYREGVAVRWLWGDIKRFFHILRGPPRDFPGRYPTRAEGLRELFGRQPARTHLETWDKEDPLPAVGEWVQGVRELVGR